MRSNPERKDAVVYVRVSTEEQANGPLNLSNQERRCRNYCAQHGFNVEKVFVDPGESARTKERPEFKKMLAFCKSNRNSVGYVVVQDLSRFARNLQNQAETIHELGRHGIVLKSATEGNIDNTAAGRLAANIYGTFNQYFSDSLSEKMRERTRQAVLAGRFPWPAPIGYVNVTATGDRPNIVPDPVRAPLVRMAFELIETGQHSKSSILAKLAEAGLRTRKNKPLSAQTFAAMLKKSVYCGWVCPPKHPDLKAKGLHEPLISEDTFRQVQRVLAGKKPTTVQRKKINPHFPLKVFVKCGACGTPLTGGQVKGRNKKYAHYWCRNSECRATKITKERLERISFAAQSTSTKQGSRLVISKNRFKDLGAKAR